MKTYLKEIKLLKKLQKDNVPHAFIITEECVNETIFTSKAILIPKFFTGYNKDGFLYLTQVHDLTAEKDVKEVGVKDLEEIGGYRLKMKNDHGQIYQWDKYDFSKICKYCTIHNSDKITHLRTGQRKMWAELIRTGAVPSIQVGDRHYIDPSILFKEEYLQKFVALKYKTQGFDLFEDDVIIENEQDFDLFDGEL